MCGHIYSGGADVSCSCLKKGSGNTEGVLCVPHDALGKMNTCVALVIRGKHYKCMMCLLLREGCLGCCC